MSKLNFRRVLLIGNQEEQKKYRLSDFTNEKTEAVKWIGCGSALTTNQNVRDLTHATLVVTFPSWHESKDSTLLVEVARLLEISVIHFSTFKK